MAPSVTRIALCDDHPIFRAGIRGLLERTDDLRIDLEVDSIGSLVAGLAAAEVDLVVLDLDLPDGAGIDHVESLSSRTRVLVLSALAEPRIVRRALERGAAGYVRKDATSEELLRHLRRAALGQTTLSSDVAMMLADSMRVDGEAARFRERLTALSSRQREVVELVAEGRSNREIAKALFLSEGTVKNYVSQILEALEVTDRTKLALLVSKHGGDA